MESNEIKQDGAAADPMALFFTQEAAEEGVKLDLLTPTGAETGHWLKVVGADSDRFRQAEHVAKQKGVKLGLIADPKEKAIAALDLQRELVAASVIGWSFDKPCNATNIIEFLRRAPQVQDAVDLMVSRRTLFFAKRSIDSSLTPSKSSDST